MVEATLFPYAVSLIAALFTALVAMIGWVGSQISRRLDRLTIAVDGTNIALSRVDKELRSEVAMIAERLTRIEARCDLTHPF